MKKAGSPGPPRKNKAIYFQARIGFSLQDLPHLVPADKLIPGIITNANNLAFTVPTWKKILWYNYSTQH